MYSYDTRMSFVCTRMSSLCHSYLLLQIDQYFLLELLSSQIEIKHVIIKKPRMSSVYHSYVLVCHPYLTGIYSYDIFMSLVCHPYVLVCHPYVLVCHPYVLVCHPYVTRMPSVCTCMSSICHSYVLVCTCLSSVSLVCHPYVLACHLYLIP